MTQQNTIFDKYHPFVELNIANYDIDTKEITNQILINELAQTGSINLNHPNIISKAIAITKGFDCYWYYYKKSNPNHDERGRFASGSSISSPYGYRTHPITREVGKHHNGTDFRAKIGTPIPSPINGTVVRNDKDKYPGQKIGNGNRLAIREEGTNKHHHFLHLNEQSHLKQEKRDNKTGKIIEQGDSVKIGDHIGYTGNTGHSEGPHLHYEVRDHTDHPGSHEKPKQEHLDFLDDHFSRHLRNK